jgi:hypothetical protein
MSLAAAIVAFKGYGVNQIRNYPPPVSLGDWGLIGLCQARVAAMTSKVVAPLSLAVSTVVLTSASALAAHMAR